MVKYFIIIEEGKIISRGYGPVIPENAIEIEKELFDQITRLPADFETNGNGNIISVTPAPETEPQPQPPSLEDRLKAVEDALLSLL
jgi:hypothetical protein